MKSVPTPFFMGDKQISFYHEKRNYKMTQLPFLKRNPDLCTRPVSCYGRVFAGTAPQAGRGALHCMVKMLKVLEYRIFFSYNDDMCDCPGTEYFRNTYRKHRISGGTYGRLQN